MKGGKKYKAGKHSEDKPEMHEINVDQGQSIARVLKHLGDRNVLVYCNDGKERIAHIRGGLSKKKAIIEVGDIVLYSNRGDGLGSEGSDKNRGDILAKYSQDLYRDLKKMEGVNPKLFLQLERVENRSAIVQQQDDGFEFDANSDEEEDDGPEEKERKAIKQAEEQKRSGARDTKYLVEEDVNVDDI
jgi:translation initiation factor 1A